MSELGEVRIVVDRPNVNVNKDLACWLWGAYWLPEALIKPLRAKGYTVIDLLDSQANRGRILQELRDGAVAITGVGHGNEGAFTAHDSQGVFWTGDGETHDALRGRDYFPTSCLTGRVLAPEIAKYGGNASGYVELFYIGVKNANDPKDSWVEICVRSFHAYDLALAEGMTRAEAFKAWEKTAWAYYDKAPVQIRAVLLNNIKARRLFLFFDGPFPTPSEEPPPPPEPPDDVVREAAWNEGGVRYNPDAAFPKYAREHGLGNPETNEFDFEYKGKQYRGQGFSETILYAEVGDWGHIREVDW